MNKYSIKSKETYIKEMNFSQVELAQIALKDGSLNVRKTALKKINDEILLKKIALEVAAEPDVEDCKLRLKALDKLTNQDFIKEVAINGKYWLVREKAVEKLNDEEILLEVANNSKDIELIIDIINKLSVESIRKIKSSEWYINAVCEDILNNY